MRREEEMKLLSYRHYQEWTAFDNLDDESPFIWLCGSFATVRGLIRIAFDSGRQDLGQKLLAVLHQDIQEFLASLPSTKP